MKSFKIKGKTQPKKPWSNIQHNWVHLRNNILNPEHLKTPNIQTQTYIIRT